MTTYIRVAASDPPGVHTFYVSSFTVSPSDMGPSCLEPIEYIVKHIRTGRAGRFWSCTCPDFVHRKQVELHHCKHIRLVKAYVQMMGGLKCVARGSKVDIDCLPQVAADISGVGT